MAMANMNLIGVFLTKLWPVQTLACGGSATKNIIPSKFSNFGDIIIWVPSTDPCGTSHGIVNSFELMYLYLINGSLLER